jgi:hypothetical protein
MFDDVLRDTVTLPAILASMGRYSRWPSRIVSEEGILYTAVDCRLSIHS